MGVGHEQFMPPPPFSIICRSCRPLWLLALQTEELRPPQLFLMCEHLHIFIFYGPFLNMFKKTPTHTWFWGVEGNRTAPGYVVDVLYCSYDIKMFSVLFSVPYLLLPGTSLAAFAGYQAILFAFSHWSKLVSNFFTFYKQYLLCYVVYYLWWEHSVTWKPGAYV